ncbi:glycosyltransferase [Candidatus Woesearchaeota archaeon]|nr:glycosyltransferase [Candidatus Woesearchaeota archaeon]
MERISIIIPVYNEEKTILKILEKIEKVNIPIEKEIIVIDDFSDDGTKNILNKKERDIKLVFHEKNLGKGAAVRTGLKHATGDIILIQDADLEYDPNDYSKLLEPIINNETKVVYGSRFLGENYEKWSSQKNIIRSHLFGNKFLSFMTQILYSRKITDMETCYKVLSKDVLANINLEARGFELEPEITAKIINKGYDIVEVPINFNPRSFEEGKKINWKDGIKALYYLVKFRFSK